MLKIENLSIQYNNRVIIDNQCMEFKRGCITGIKGASGTGKSSVLNVLGCIKDINKGCSYIFDDHKVDEFDEEEKAQFRLNHIAFIFQQGNLLNNLTTSENIALPLMMCEKDEKNIAKQVDKWLAYVGLEELRDSYPEDLSGGEEQRVAIARALVNECDIILADEPTASLDADNSDRIMSVLTELAHKFNKIVIVVSHDDSVIECCDCVYSIENKKIIKTKENKSKEVETYSAGKKKRIREFIKRYEELRRKEYKLNKALIAITSVIIAITCLSFNFGETFVDEQKKFINSISDRRILVINDTMGLNSTGDYSEAMSFKKDILHKIQEIPNVDKVYEYYEFSSYGIAVEDGVSKIEVYLDEGDIVKKEYNNSYIADGNEYTVAPIYPEDDVRSFLEYKNEDENGVYLSYNMACSLVDNIEDLVGKKMVLTCFVPTKLYLSEATKPVSKDEEKNSSGNQRIEIDGYISKLVEIEVNVAGILDNSYENDRSINNGNFIMLGFDKMNKIIEENIDSTETQSFEGFEERELASSMLVVYVDNFDDLAKVEEKINTFSSSISIINKAGDISKIQNNIDNTRNIMVIISIVLVVITTIMFSLLYFYKNRERNKEIGILKAIGLSKKDVLRLIANNMRKNTIYTILLSGIIAVVIKEIFNKIIGGSIMSICTTVNRVDTIFNMFLEGTRSYAC